MWRGVICAEWRKRPMKRSMTNFKEETAVSCAEIRLKIAKVRERSGFSCFNTSPQWLKLPFWMWFSKNNNEQMQLIPPLSCTQVLPKTWEQMVRTPIDQNSLGCGTSELKSVPMPLNLLQEVIKACQTNFIRRCRNVASWGRGLECKWIVPGVRKPQTCSRRVDASERYRKKKKWNTPPWFELLANEISCVVICAWITHSSLLGVLVH